MCIDPMTAMMVGTAALSATGSLMDGEAAAQGAAAQQRAYEQQARADAQSAAFERERAQYKQDLAMSAARAATGAAGVAITGSPTEVLAAQAREFQLDLEAIAYGSALRQNQLRTQGRIARWQGSQARVASFINAGSKLLSAGQSIYERGIDQGAGQPAYTRKIELGRGHPVFG